MIASVIISLIAAIAAIVAPMITTYMNNRHSAKMRKLDLIAEKRISVINEFVSNISKYLVSEDIVLEEELGSSICSIYLYCPEDLWNDLDKLYNCIITGKRDQAKALMPAIAKKLSSSVTRLEK